MKNLIFTAILFSSSLFYSNAFAQLNKAIYSIIIADIKEVINTPVESYYKTAQENSRFLNFQLNLLLMIVAVVRDNRSGCKRRLCGNLEKTYFLSRGCLFKIFRNLGQSRASVA
jgi:hypothetical protein